MSAIKTSHIHDGFATIRSRGVQRSHSRVEQLERMRPPKSDSLPLYESPQDLLENNNDAASMNNNYDDAKKAVYSFRQSDTAIGDTLHGEATVLQQIEGLRLDAGSSNACSSFKSSSGNLRNSFGESTERSSLPPPSPCYESASNGFHTPKTPDSQRSAAGEYFLYSRPTSPIYERFAGAQSGANPTALSSSPETNAPSELYGSSPRQSLFAPTYFRKSTEYAEYALQQVVKKPAHAYKSQSLQYRKSFSHPSQTIYETLPDRNVRSYYNPATNYYDPSEISYAAHSPRRPGASHSAELLNSSDDERPAPSPLAARNGYEKRFATLAHPRDMQRLQSRHEMQQQRKYGATQFSASQTDVDYIDPLDCKIGCQTTLRSKPQIPWYELAIKRENRRQSCPPLQVNFTLALLCLLRCRVRDVRG